LPEPILSYGYSDSFSSNTDYDDVEAIARIGSADMNLQARFEVFNQEILENFYRLAGHIYSAADLKKLNLEKRPNFEWNLFRPILLAVVGNFKNAIPSCDFFGESPLEEATANLQKKLNDYVLFQANDIEYELAKAFLWAVVGRIGWLKTSWCYDNDPEGMVKVEWYNSLRLKFDINWTRRDTKDMRYISDSGWYSAEEIMEIYAHKNPDLREIIYDRAETIVGESALKKGKLKKMMATWAERFLNDSLPYQGKKHGYDSFSESDVNYRFNGTWYNSDGRFKVIDWYEKRLEPIMKITDLTTGQEQDVTDIVRVEGKENERNWFDKNKLAMLRQQFVSPVVKQSYKEIIWQTSVVPALNLKLYDAPQKWQSGYFKFIPVLCYDFHPNILETRSIMDDIIDPVSSYNVERNTILTYIMKMTKGGWIAEEGAVKGFEDELMSNDLVGLKKVANGALTSNRIQPIQPPTYPVALAEHAMSEKEDLQIISAQSPNVQGRKESAKETGVLFQSRVAQANVMQSWISDNAQYSVLLIAYNSLAIIQTYLKMPRAIMILGDEANPEWILLNQRSLGNILNDVTYGRYNIRISKQPYGRKAQEAEFERVMQINTWLQSIDKAYIDPTIALKIAPLTVKNEMIQHIKQVQQRMLEAQMQENQQNQQMQQQAAQDQAEMGAIQKATAKADLMKKIADAQGKALENQQMSADKAKKEADTIKILNDVQMNSVQKMMDSFLAKQAVQNVLKNINGVNAGGTNV
jgi:hypothetical protein